MTKKSKTTLTAREKKVIRYVFNGMKQADAYQKAYQNSGKKYTLSTARGKASLLVNSIAGKVYMESLDDDANYDAIMTKAEALEKLVNITDDTDASNSDVTNAIKQFGKMTGFETPQEVKVDIQTINVNRV